MAVPNALVLKLCGGIEKEKRERRNECFKGGISLGIRDDAADDENLHI